jgi:hypothetical protein
MSLGKNCLWEEQNYTCEGGVDDNTAPTIWFDNSTLNGYYTNKTELHLHTKTYEGYEILPEITPYEILRLKIGSDEPTQCKFDFVPTIFTDLPEDYMPALWFGDMIFNTSHEVALRIPPHVSLPEKLLDLLNISDIKNMIAWFHIPDHLYNEIRDKYSTELAMYQTLTGRDLLDEAQDWLDQINEFKIIYTSIIDFLEELVREMLKQFDSNGYYMFIKCKDRSGNTNSDEMFIKFRISDMNDNNPPIILNSRPRNATIINNDTREIPIKIYVSEPADCAYYTEDLTYGAMEIFNKMECPNSIFDISPEEHGSYECTTTVDVENDTVFYFRCRDQPVETNDYMLNLFKGDRLDMYGGPSPLYYNLSYPSQVDITAEALKDDNMRIILNSTFVDMGLYFNEKKICRYSDNASHWFEEMTSEFNGCEMSDDIRKGVYVCKERINLNEGFSPMFTETVENYSMQFQFDLVNRVDDPAKRQYIEFKDNQINILRSDALEGNGTKITINNSFINVKLNLFGNARCRWGETEKEFDGQVHEMGAHFDSGYTEIDSDIHIPMDNFRVYIICKTLFDENSGNNSQFSIKCRDENVTPLADRNVMDESYELILIKGKELEVDVGPSGIVNDHLVNLTATLNRNMTSDGIICGYNDDGQDGIFGMDVFNDTMLIKTLDLDLGNNTFYVRCEDRDGVIVRKNTTIDFVI